MAHVLPSKDPMLMKLMAKEPVKDYDSDYTPSTDNPSSKSYSTSRKRPKLKQTTMAPKSKSLLVDKPPSTSSSEEEEVEESLEDEEQSAEEEEESGEDEEEESKTADNKSTTTQKPLQFQTPQQKPHTPSSSTESDGSGSDSDADSGQPSPSVPDLHVSVPAVATSSKPSTKRTQEQAQKEKESKSMKKPKISEDEKNSSSAVTTSSRLWNDEDQIALLKGMAEFKAQKGSDVSFFYDFIKGKLQVQVSKTQLSDKLKKLKKKFLTALKTTGDERPVFAKPHDSLVFELSKKIWGSVSNGVTENVNVNGKAKKTAAVEVKKPKKIATSTKPKDDEKQVTVKEDVVQQQVFKSKYPLVAAALSMDELTLVYGNSVDMLKKNMSLIPDDKAKVLEEKWKKFHDEEHKLLAKRLELITEHVNLVVGTKIGN